MAIRNISMAGFFAMPALAFFGIPNGIFKGTGKKRFRSWAISLLFGLAPPLGILCGGEGGSRWSNFGVGLMPGVSEAGEFIRNVPIEGPIFNNYDLGSYLVYYLFPKSRVFVDNRPEAYPDEFFTRLYVPMQEDESIWKIQSEKWGINAIAFYWRDLTPWSQTFLLARVQDPNWIPVFRNPYSLVFVKNVAKNLEVIRQFSVDRREFRVRGGQ
jgi:hypothetical protein